MPKGYFFVIAAALLGGGSGLFIKALHTLPPASIGFFRFAVPTLALGAYLLYKHTQPFHGRYRWMLAASAINAVRMILVITGFLLIPLSIAQVILFTWPIFGILFSKKYLKEKIHPFDIGLLLAAFLGIVLIFLQYPLSSGPHMFAGMIFILFSAILNAVVIIMMKHVINEYTGVEIIFHQNLIGGIMSLPFFFLHTPLPNQFETLAGIGYGLCIGLVIWLLYYAGLRYMSSTHFGILSYLEVPAAIVYGILILNEEITPMTIVGTVIIIGAGIVLLIKKNHTMQSAQILSK